MTVVPTAWRKSSYSGDKGNCVEVAPALDGGLWLRDSKSPAQGTHRYTSAAWRAFMREVKLG